MKEKIAGAVFLVLSIAIVGLLSRFTPLIEGLELRNYDFLMLVRGPQPAPDDIVIVAIDHTSLDVFKEQGFPWPWPRSIHGELVRALDQAGARLTVFDIVFDLPSADPGQDAYFAQSIADVRMPVILAATREAVSDPRYEIYTELLPLDILTEAGADFGYALLSPDNDAVLRHGRLSVVGEPTLSVRAYEKLVGPLDVSWLPVVRYADGTDPEILIDYVGPGRSIKTTSYSQALDYEAALGEGFFRDKIVFVGRSQRLQDLTRSGQADMFVSPFEGLRGALEMPGTEVHANILNSLLKGRFKGQIPPRSMLAISALLALAVTIILLQVQRFKVKLALALSLLLAFTLFTWLAFVQWNLWVWSVQPLLVGGTALVLNFFYQYRGMERERAKIRNALEGYVSGPVMQQVMNSPGMLELGGVQVQATVLFSDIASFSKIAESMTPKDLSNRLNEYFTQIGDAIMERQGMINKYIGDAVMAVWGVPLPKEDHAAEACRAALAMKHLVDGMADIEARTGINTGLMVAGNLGHRRRMEYTVIGDSVNLASRLEGVNKAFGTSIIISEFTEELVRGRFLTRKVDSLRVMGKAQPVKVYELLAEENGDAPGRLRRMAASFNKIMQAYDIRDWQLACELIEEHIKEFPEDLVVRKAYQQRCRAFLESPPPAGWDGVYEMAVK